MRASILADGMTSRLRCDLVMTAGLDGMEGSVVDQMRKPRLIRQPGGYQFSSSMMHYRYCITDDERHIIMWLWTDHQMIDSQLLRQDTYGLR